VVSAYPFSLPRCYPVLRSVPAGGSLVCNGPYSLVAATSYTQCERRATGVCGPSKSLNRLADSLGIMFKTYTPSDTTASDPRESIPTDDFSSTRSKHPVSRNAATNSHRKLSSRCLERELPRLQVARRLLGYRARPFFGPLKLQVLKPDPTATLPSTLARQAQNR